MDAISSSNYLLCSLLISKTRVSVLQWTSSVASAPMLDSANYLESFVPTRSLTKISTSDSQI